MTRSTFGRRISRKIWILLVVSFLCMSSAAAAGTFGQETLNGRIYWLYVPAGYQAGTAVPLVMMLHGCTQSGDAFATSTGMNAVAEEEVFLVAYPQQPSSANSTQCWNWFEPAHQSRGSGEPAHLAGVVGDIASAYTVDPERVFVAGFSAGGAMAVILAATYPDVFTAAGVHSGIEYQAATSVSSAFTAMFSGGPAADPQGQLAYNAMGSRARVVPAIIFHGTSDFTVATVNGDLVLSQWAQTNDLAANGVDDDEIDDTAELVEVGQVAGGRGYTRYVYEDGAGEEIMEKVRVDGMGHSWSGGTLGGTFTDPDGPDASRLMIDFFLGSQPVADTTPPTTTAAPAGGTYSSSLVVNLAADEPATTYYTIDGSTPDTSSTVYTAALSIAVDTTLRFFSVDAAGNQEAVRSEVYVIDAGSDSTAPVTTASPPGGSISEPLDVILSVNEPATTYFTIDGSTPSTASSIYDAPISIVDATTLRFFSVDAAGNTEVTRSEVYTFVAVSSVTLTSIDGEDGYVGQLWADGSSTTLHRAGDKGMFNTDTYRLILSFDTSAIASNATIISATLTIHRAALAGSVSQLTADVATLTFGASAGLVPSDYAAAATQNHAFTVSVPASDGAAASTSLPAAVLGLIPGNRFQIRLAASAPINFASDVLTIHGGGAGALAPTLEVAFE